ncbi:hypothetical protein PoB_004987300 [Plakobranchus ocellatus]|uniref:Partner and localiser of BRCA2 WD40 domain-containing protein n=1 Tax=Plakobranchus ocellatus TaxID=259542 RepID=A0AAV4BX43_9GAST|nr:hypothetical protein PoB_004987300 [Plakobranchus ocellatus]
MDDEKQKMLQKLLEMKREVAEKQKKLERAKRAARVKAHVKKKIREHEEMEQSSNRCEEQKGVASKMNTKNSLPVPVTEKLGCSPTDLDTSQYCDVMLTSFPIPAEHLSSRQKCISDDNHLKVSSTEASHLSSAPSEQPNSNKSHGDSGDKAVLTSSKTSGAMSKHGSISNSLPVAHQLEKQLILLSHKHEYRSPAGLENNNHSPDYGLSKERSLPNRALKTFSPCDPSSESLCEIVGSSGFNENSLKKSPSSLKRDHIAKKSGESIQRRSKVRRQQHHIDSCCSTKTGKILSHHVDCSSKSNHRTTRQEVKRSTKVPLKEKAESNLDKRNEWLDFEDFKSDKSNFKAFPKKSIEESKAIVEHQDQNGWLSTTRMRSMGNSTLNSKRTFLTSPLTSKVKLFKKDRACMNSRKLFSHASTKANSSKSCQSKKPFDARLADNANLGQKNVSGALTEFAPKNVSVSEACVFKETGQAHNQDKQSAGPFPYGIGGANPGFNSAVHSPKLASENRIAKSHSQSPCGSNVDSAAKFNNVLFVQQHFEHSSSELDEEVMNTSQLDIIINADKMAGSRTLKSQSQESLGLTPTFRTPIFPARLENQKADAADSFGRNYPVTDSEFLNILGISEENRCARTQGVGDLEMTEEESAIHRHCDKPTKGFSQKTNKNEENKGKNSNSLPEENASKVESGGPILKDRCNENLGVTETCSVFDTFLPPSQTLSEFSDYTELDSVPFSHFELSEDFLSEDASFPKSGKKQVNKNTGALVRRRSRRISSTKPSQCISSFLSNSQAYSTENAAVTLGFDPSSKFTKNHRQSQAQQRKAAAILSIFQFLKDKAKEPDSACEFALTPDFEDLKREKLCGYPKTFNVHTKNPELGEEGQLLTSQSVQASKDKTSSLLRSSPVNPESVTDKSNDSKSFEPTDKIDDSDNHESIVDKLDDLENLQPFTDIIDDLDNLQPQTDKIDDLENLQPLTDKIDDLDNLQSLTDKIDDDLDNLQPLTDKIDDLDNLQRLTGKIDDLDNLQPLTDKIDDLDTEPPTDISHPNFMDYQFISKEANSQNTECMHASSPYNISKKSPSVATDQFVNQVAETENLTESVSKCPSNSASSFEQQNAKLPEDKSEVTDKAQGCDGDSITSPKIDVFTETLHCRDSQSSKGQDSPKNSVTETGKTVLGCDQAQAESSTTLKATGQTEDREQQQSLLPIATESQCDSNTGKLSDEAIFNHKGTSPTSCTAAPEARCMCKSSSVAGGSLQGKSDAMKETVNLSINMHSVSSRDNACEDVASIETDCVVGANNNPEFCIEGNLKNSKFARNSQSSQKNEKFSARNEGNSEQCFIERQYTSNKASCKCPSPQISSMHSKVSSPSDSIKHNCATPISMNKSLLNLASPKGSVRSFSRRSLSFTSTPIPTKKTKAAIHSMLELDFGSPVLGRDQSENNQAGMSDFDRSQCVFTAEGNKTLSASSPGVPDEAPVIKKSDEADYSVSSLTSAAHELSVISLVPDCDESYPSPGQIPISDKSGVNLSECQSSVLEDDATVIDVKPHLDKTNTSNLSKVTASPNVVKPWKKLPRTASSPVQILETEQSERNQGSFSFMTKRPHSKFKSQNNMDTKSGLKFLGCFQSDSQDAVVALLCGSVSSPAHEDRPPQTYIVSVQATALTVWAEDVTFGWTTELDWRLSPETHILKACLMPGSARVAVLITGWVGSSPFASVLTYDWYTEDTMRFNIGLENLPRQLNSLIAVELCPVEETRLYLGLSSDDYHSVLRADLSANQNEIVSTAIFQQCRGRLLSIVSIEGQRSALLTLSSDQKLTLWNCILGSALKSVVIAASMPCLEILISAKTKKGLVLMDTLWRVDDGYCGGLIAMNPLNGQQIVLHRYRVPNNLWRRLENCKKESRYITAVSDQGALCIWDSFTGVLLASTKSKITTCVSVTESQQSALNVIVGEIHGCMHIYSSSLGFCWPLPSLKQLPVRL